MINNIAICFPGALVKSILINKPEFVFVDINQIEPVSAVGGRKKILIGDVELNNVTDGFSIESIRNEINFWSPIWSSWIGRSESYELYKDESIVKVLSIIKLFKEYKIRGVMFHTSIPHHYDSSLLFTASKIMKLDTVFLYPTIAGSFSKLSRLLPLIVRGNLCSRTFFPNSSISDYDASNDIEFFIQCKMNDKPITLAETTPIRQSYAAAIVYVIWAQIKRYLSRFVMQTSKAFPPDHGFWSHIRMINAQRAFLKKYSLSSNEALIDLNKGTPNLIVTVHYHPDATTFPESGGHASHVEVVAMLNKIKWNKKIFYKEHPATSIYFDTGIVGLSRVGMNRSLNYYNLLVKLGCQFLPINFKLPVNDQHNYLPVTMTGSIAVERSFLGLHTVVSGYPWYVEMPGVIRISEFLKSESFNRLWIKPDPNLANSAREWFALKLRNTIPNALGIGNGMPTDDSYFEENFLTMLNEFDKLICNN